jgi:pimeloyl-ACP methyl ester carboxylesterase
MSSATIISVKDRHVRVRVEGNTAEPPVLLLHGLGRSLEDWVPQHDRLAGYRTIALDMPGFGFSDRPSGSITLPVFAQGVLDTLNVLGERRPLHVMGNSLGGAVALQLLVLEPQRVATLVLVNSAGFGRKIHPLIRLMAVPVIGGLATRVTTRASARMIERTIFADPSLVTNERIDHALEIARQSDTGAVVHETARLLGTSRGIRQEWRKKLITEASNHQRPTLIVWGDRDRILPAHQLEAACQLLPHAQHHLFAGTGHMPQIESADEFAELALDFIRSSAPRR